MHLQKKIILLLIVSFLLFSFTGCDLISKYLGIDLGGSPIKITDPANGQTVSGTYTFIGVFSGSIDSVILKIGDQEFKDVTLSVNGTWKVTVDLSIFPPGDYTVTAYGYEGITEIDHYSIMITIEGSQSLWLDLSSGAAKYVFLDDPDYSGSPAKLTDVTTDGNYLYIGGYYLDTGTSKFRPFVYKVDPVAGNFVKKYVWETDFSYSNNPNPVLVEYASPDDSVYVAFSQEDTSSNPFNYAVRKLKSDLTLSYEYSYTPANTFHFNDMVYDGSGAEPALYFTGNIDGASIMVLQVKDYGSSLAQGIYGDSGLAGDGYGIVNPASSSYLYVAGRYYSGSNYAAVIRFAKSDLSVSSQNTSVHINGEFLGATYGNGYIYATGYFKNGSGYDRSTALEQIDPADISIVTDHGFSITSAAPYDVNDEAGLSVIYDSGNQYYVLAGNQKRTSSDFSAARASVCVRDSSYNEVKTVIFEESGYGESSFYSVVQIGTDYLGVGYAKDDSTGNYKPLILELSSN